MGWKVFVGNVSWDAAWQDLKDHMRGPNGDLNVLRAEIMTDGTGRSKGCAVVEYGSQNDAQRAIAELNDTTLLGRMIFVREDREGGGGGKRVYVGNLSWQVRWQELKDHMRKVGEVLHADVLVGQDNRSKGCGLVEYSSPAEAQAAIEHLNNTDLMGRPIFVREDREDGSVVPALAPTVTFAGFGGAGFAGPFGGGAYSTAGYGGGGGMGGGYGGGGGRRVFVGNLPWDSQWQEVKDHMRTAGEVSYVDVLSGPDGRPKGCALVEYASPQDAARAIGRLNGSLLQGRAILVREDRDAR